MQIDRAGTELAAARERQDRPFHAADDGAQKNNRRAHFAHQVIGDVEVACGARIDGHVPAGTLHLTAQMPQNLDSRVHI